MASSHETAVEALRASLALINTNDGYAYTPDAVERVVFFPDQVSLDPGLSTIYLIRPGEEQQQLKDSGNTAIHLEVFVLVAQRFGEATENPHLSDPRRWQIAVDLVADVLQRIGNDNHLGGAVIDCARGGFRVDYERYLERWVLAEIRMVIHFHRTTRGR